MTDHESTAPAGNESIGTASTTDNIAIGADRIDAYITSVEHVLLAARVPATERVQILGDLETQITEMLQSEPLPISDDTVAAVISRLEPPSHFAATYAAEPQQPQSAAALTAAQRYSPWVLAAAGSCAMLILSCLLLLLFLSPNPSARRSPSCSCCCYLPARSQHRSPFAKASPSSATAPDQYLGQSLATGTALVYWTAVPLLLLLFACASPMVSSFIPIGLAAFAYVHYLLLRRLHHRLTNPATEQRTPRSFRDSLWRFTRLAQPTSC